MKPDTETLPPADEGRLDQRVVPLVPEREGFTPDELRLGYTQWKALSNARRRHLSSGAHAWLSAWNLWDLACSPMDDIERRQIRYGHYLGWWGRSCYHERHNARVSGPQQATQA